MAKEPINYEAVLADLEEKKKQIESAIAAIKMIAAHGGTFTPGSGAGQNLGPSAFLKMSIPDATKKFLEATRQKQSTQAVIEALAEGGLPKSKYTTMYSILSRRQRQVGDIINMQGDWALAEWYPNYRKGKQTKEEEVVLAEKKGVMKKAERKQAKSKKVKEAKSAAPTPTPMAAAATA